MFNFFVVLMRGCRADVEQLSSIANNNYSNCALVSWFVVLGKKSKTMKNNLKKNKHKWKKVLLFFIKFIENVIVGLVTSLILSL